jgi:hypothetical protein
VIVPQTPSPRGFFSDQAYVVELESEPRRAIAEVAANSRSDSQFPKFPRPALDALLKWAALRGEMADGVAIASKE